MSPQILPAPARAVFLADPSPSVAAQAGGWAGAANGRLELHTFTTARQLLRRLEYQRPDLLMLNVTLPGFDGLTALRSLSGAGTPIVLLSPDTMEGARLTMEALLAGASDYVVERRRGGKTLLALRRTGFQRALQRYLSPSPDASGGPIRSPGEIFWGRRSTWVQLRTDGEAVEARPLRGEVLPRSGSWVGIVLAAAPRLPRVVETFTRVPDRPAGPMILRIPQGPRFGRAMREVISRRWNRTVLELRPGEMLRAGHWRVLPGRSALRPRFGPQGAPLFDLAPNRLRCDARSMTQQLALLRDVFARRLRIYLFEKPRGMMIEPLRDLLEAGHGVFIHQDPSHSRTPLTRRLAP